MKKPSSSLSLGDPVLDQEHTEFQRLIEILLQAQPSGAIAALAALKAHAAKHFELEDQDLRRQGDGNATCHLDEHAAVLRSMDEVAAVLAQPESPQGLAPRLASELLRWLPEHVHAMDASVAAARARERFGGQPVQVMRQQPAYSPPKG
jgi:hemerythrin-like metal-binding protein